MIQLMYESERALLTNEKDINDIVKCSVTRNKAMHVTGLLVCLPNHFYQVLEGDEQDVSSLMESITHDHRHHGVRVIHRQYINHREFPMWSMAHFDIDDAYKESFQVLEKAAHAGEDIYKCVEGVLLVLKGLKPF